tara:strand:- start:15 stop:293 length:279 start_codon:yes stop_codon:yes gene_type:complete
MGLSKNYFMELQEMYHAGTQMVESVKLGDVMCTIEKRKSGLAELIENSEKDLIRFKNENNDHMASYCQSCIDRFQFAIEQLDSVYGIIKLYK